MSTTLNKTSLVEWLKENEEFTNEFICEWVWLHPELHLALFKSNPSFTPYEVTLPDSILDPANSKDSGVDIDVQGDRIESEPSLEKGVSLLQISTTTKERPQAPEVHPDTLRAERLEAMLDMSGYLHAKLFAPHDIIKRVMHSAQHFMKCTLVYLLLKEPLPFLDASSETSWDEVQFAKAFVVSTKLDFEFPRKVCDEYLPYLDDLAKQTELAGTTLEVDSETNHMCLVLRGWGTTVGFLVMTHTEDELLQVTELDLMYLEFFSHICGMAIDNAISIAAMKSYTSGLCEKSLKQQISECSSSNGSISSCVKTVSTTCDQGVRLITHSSSCPEMRSFHAYV